MVDMSDLGFVACIGDRTAPGEDPLRSKPDYRQILGIWSSLGSLLLQSMRSEANSSLDKSWYQRRTLVNLTLCLPANQRAHLTDKCQDLCHPTRTSAKFRSWLSTVTKINAVCTTSKLRQRAISTVKPFDNLYHTNMATPFSADQPVTIRTRKFITNRLLSRKQMVV